MTVYDLKTVEVLLSQVVFAILFVHYQMFFVQLASAGDPEACAEGWRKPVYKKLHDCVG